MGKITLPSVLNFRKNIRYTLVFVLFFTVSPNLFAIKISLSDINPGLDIDRITKLESDDCNKNITLGAIVPPTRDCSAGDSPIFPSLVFTNPTPESAGANVSDAEFNDVFRFSLVASGIDAIVEVLDNGSGGDPGEIDQAPSTGGFGVEGAFQPVINSTGGGDQSVDYRITFVNNGDPITAPVSINFFASGLDIDGYGAGNNEYVEITEPDTYRTNGGSSNLTITDPGTGLVNSVRFQCSNGGGIGGVGTNPTNAFTGYYEGFSQIIFRAGKVGAASTRFSSLLFEDITYSDPADVFASNPVICGTVTNQDGDPLNGISVSLSDGQNTVTNGMGGYEFTVAGNAGALTITETDGADTSSVSDVDGANDNMIDINVGRLSVFNRDFVDSDDDDGDGVTNANDQCPGFDDTVDADNDTVPDGCDLDDDNDGILDADENNCTSVPNGVFDWDVDFSNQIGTGQENNIQNNLPLVSNVVDGRTLTVTLSDPNNDINELSIIQSFGSAFGRIFEIEHQTGEVGGSTTTFAFDEAVQNVNFEMVDIDTASGSFEDLLVVNVKRPDGSVIEIVPANITLQGDHVLFEGNNTFRGDPAEGNAGNNDQGGRMILNFNEPVLSIDFTYSNVDGTRATSQRIGIGNLNFTQACDVDSDGDGIENRLDLDSDNDGCPDFVEGGGMFTPADGQAASGTVTDGNGNMVTTNLGITVQNTNPGGADYGVPTVAGGGQDIGYSQDASDNLSCLTPDGDDDGDGVLNSADMCPGGDDNADSDNDTVPDFCDVDDDNDGITDMDEGCIDFIYPEDFFIPLYHANIVNSPTGEVFVTGQDANPNGTNNIREFTQIVSGGPINGTGGGDTNWPAFNGETVKAVGADSSDPQFVLLTTTDLYAWGTTTELLSTTMKPNTNFGSIPFPVGVTASDVFNITSGSGVLAIITNTGNVFTTGSDTEVSSGDIFGNGTTAIDANNWYQVQSEDGPLTGIIDLDITERGAFAVQSTGRWFTWGQRAFLGDGNTHQALNVATEMVLPADFISPTFLLPQQIEMASSDGAGNSNGAIYYALHPLNNRIYALGENVNGILGINSNAGDAQTWTTVMTNSGPLENVVFIGCNSYSKDNPSGGAITDDGSGNRDVYLWGINSNQTLSDGLNSPQIFAGIPSYDDSTYIDTNGDSAITSADRFPIRVATGGHLSMYFDRAQDDYAFVGHNADGSFGATVSDAGKFSVSPATVQLVPEAQNTDGLGNSDCKDVDSDEDGCFDAVEGDGTFTLADVDPATGYLTGPVDTNPSSPTYGMPTAAGTGQGVGDSATVGPDLDLDGIADACDPTDDRPDVDMDGIPDVVDLDDDNDGILDTVECPQPANSAYQTIEPADFGITTTSTTNSINATADVSAKFGLPAGSVIVTVVDGNTVASGGNAGWRVSMNSNTRFEISGTVPVFARNGHGSALTDIGDRDGFVGILGDVYGDTPTPESGYMFFNDGPNYYLEVIDNTADGTQVMRWISERPVSIVDFYTTNNTTFGNAINISLAPCPDFDGDGVADVLDLDSDNDGIYDVTESGGTDTDNDGLADDDDDNADNSASNGIPTSAGMGNTPTDSGPTPGTPDYLDTDSDEDGCSDANEAYGNTTADGGDGDQYGTGQPSTDSVNGTVNAATYPATSFPADNNGTAGFDFQQPDTPATNDDTTLPADVITFAGADAVFSSDFSGTNLMYQWFVSTDGVNFAAVSNGTSPTGGVYSGVTTDELTYTAVTPLDDGNLYQVRVTGGSVCNDTPVISRNALLTVQTYFVQIRPVNDGAENNNGATTPIEYEVFLTSDAAGTVPVVNMTGMPITADIAFPFANGTASAADVGVLPATVSIPNNAGTVSVTVPVLNDTEIEGTETLVAVISNPSANVNVGDSDMATGSITDADGTATVNIELIENGEEGGLATQFQVVLRDENGNIVTNQSGVDLMVDIAFSDAATIDDFTPSNFPMTITIGNGESTTPINLPVVDDLLIEGDETLTATISNVSGGTGNETIGQATDDAVIVDNDGNALVTISTVQNGSEGTIFPNDETPVVFEVTLTNANGDILTNATGLPLDVDVSNITAVGPGLSEDADFVTPFTNPSTFTIPDGASSVAINLPVAEDNLAEGAESITLQVDSINANGAPGVAIVPAPVDTATASIIDNEATDATVRIETTQNGDENDPVDATDEIDVIYRISLFEFDSTNGASTPIANGTGGDVEVDIEFSNTTANANDFDAGQLAPRTIIIPNGGAFADVIVTVAEDFNIENLENVTATIVAVRDVSPTLTFNVDSQLDMALATVADNDNSPVFEVTVDSGDGDEGNTTLPGDEVDVEFTVTLVDAAGNTLVNTTGGNIIADIALNGTAEQADFTSPFPTEIIIPNNASSGSESLPVADDPIIEETETIRIEAVSNAANPITVQAGNASANVLDNDVATVTIVASMPTGNETGPVDGEFTVALVDGAGNPITSTTDTVVTLILDGASTATSGDDFTPLTLTVTIPAGSSEILIPVPVINDVEVEGAVNETVILNIDSVMGDDDITIDPVLNSATVEIIDNNANPPIAQDDVSGGNDPGTTVVVNVVADNGNGVDQDIDGTLDLTSVALELPAGVTNIVLDPDGSGDVIGYTVPGEGEWQVNPVNGEVSFIPQAGFTQDPTDPASYTIDDNNMTPSNVATVTIDYVPVSMDDVSDNNVTNTPVEVDVLANDTDGDLVDPTTVQIVGTANAGDDLVVPNEGTWSVDPATGAITFTPEAGFTGNPAPIEYTVMDDEGNLTDPAMVTVTFAVQPPVAVDDMSNNNVTGTPAVVDVLDNDNDPDGMLDVATVQIVGTANQGDDLVVPGEGTWSINPANGEITFTPEVGFTGSPSDIMYTVDDNDGNTSNQATVSVMYDAQPPVAQDDESLANTPGMTVSVDVADNDNDPDGMLDLTSVSLVVPTGATMVQTDADGDVTGYTVPGEGAWEVNPANGEISFAPQAGFTQDPTDPASYTIDDNDGNPSNEATVTIDYVPVSMDDVSDNNDTGVPVTVDVLANDVDGDIVDPTTVQIVGTTNPGDSLVEPGVGVWTIDSATGAITFTPCTAAGVPDTSCTGLSVEDPAPIMYTVMDDEGNFSNPSIVTVTFDECNGMGLGDCDGDGTPNNVDPDPNNPCIDDNTVGDEDTTNPIWQAADCDGDGQINGDDPGPYDPCEGGNLANVDLSDMTSDWYTADCDGDGVVNGTEVDPQGDGTPGPDSTDPNDPCDFNMDDVSVPQSGDYLAADCDGDGVSNGDEIADGTDPQDPCDFDDMSVTLPQSGDYLDADCDGDGESNGDEIDNGTDPNDPCEGGNLANVDLSDINSDWYTADCDGDGVTNGTEVDPDGDGTPGPDNTDPNDPCDFNMDDVSVPQSGDYLAADCDGDGVSNGDEIADGTDPTDPCDFNDMSVTLPQSGDYLDADCDGDGASNGDEIDNGTDPTDPCEGGDLANVDLMDTDSDWYLADCDGDGVINGTEVDPNMDGQSGPDDTDPNDPCDFNMDDVSVPQSGDYLAADCDGDGVSNGDEIADGTDPTDPCDFNDMSVTLPQSGDYLDADCDGDGASNGDEIDNGTDPTDPCEGGNLANVDLSDINSDWYTADCDGDGVINGTEVDPNMDGTAGPDDTDPNDPCDFNMDDVTVAQTDNYLNGDCDGDGVTNGDEIADGTDPQDPCDYDMNSQTLPTSGEWMMADCDGDGVTNQDEVNDGTDPLDPCDFVTASMTITPSDAFLVADCDGDGVTNGDELIDGTGLLEPCEFMIENATVPQTPVWESLDCDGDGVTNGDELNDMTNPLDPCDYVIANQTQPTSGDWMMADCDNDGVSNQDEVNDGTNPLDPCSLVIANQDPAADLTLWNTLDCDGDGVTNGQEIVDGTDPLNECDLVVANQDIDPSEAWEDDDCDGDGVTNGDEVIDGTDPVDPCSFMIENATVPQTPVWEALDCDGDGVTNGDELIDGTDPSDPCDYIADSQTLPTSADFDNLDCDGDGNPNGTDPDPNDPCVFDVALIDSTIVSQAFLDADCDGDGVTNGDEISDGTNPNDACEFIPESMTVTPGDAFLDLDCDGDGVTNGQEFDDGTNPQDSCDFDFDSQDIDYENQIVAGVSDAWLNFDCDNDGIPNGDEIADVNNNGIPDYLESNNNPNPNDDINVFDIMTPNGDGLNDVFVINGLQNFPRNTVRIYNRWGVEVYGTEGYGQNDNFFRGLSDGRATIDRDEKLPVGTYYYVIEYVDADGDTQKLAGPLYINRR